MIKYFIKVGEKNPVVTLSIEDLTNGVINPVTLPFPTEVTQDHVLGIVFWISSTKLGAIWLNRRQNKGVFAVYTLTGTNWVYDKVKYKSMLTFSCFIKKGESRIRKLKKNTKVMHEKLKITRLNITIVILNSSNFNIIYLTRIQALIKKLSIHFLKLNPQK